MIYYLDLLTLLLVAGMAVIGGPWALIAFVPAWTTSFYELVKLR